MGTRVNYGSGQRPFGFPRPVVVDSKHPCICGITYKDHGEAMRSNDYPHRYVPDAPDAWLNVDLQMSKFDTADAGSIKGLPDESAEIIVAHHILEHVELSAADGLIREWHRVLEPGGSLLVFVPDMRATAERWLDGRINDYIFAVTCMGAWMGDPADCHRWLYWGPSLKKKLNNACKWSSVRLFDWRKIPGADCCNDWWILGMEAVK